MSDTIEVTLLDVDLEILKGNKRESKQYIKQLTKDFKVALESIRDGDVEYEDG